MIINMIDTLHEYEYNLDVKFVVIFINMVWKMMLYCSSGISYMYHSVFEAPTCMFK